MRGPSGAETAASRPGTPQAAAVPTAGGGLFHALQVAVVVLDPNGRIAVWSPLAEAMLGWRAEQVTGRRAHRIIAGWSGRPAGGEASGDGSPAVVGQLLAEVARAGVWSGSVRLRHRDGRIVEAEARATLMAEGAGEARIPVALAEAHTVHRLEQDVALADAVIDSSPLGIAIYDTELRIVRVNDALARITGRSRGEHLGRTIAEIIPGETGEELGVLQRTVLETGRTIVDFRTRTASGAGYQSASYSRITDRSGRVLGLAGMIMDVTDRIAAAARAERARARLALLNDVGGILADLLDVRRLSGALAEALVPAFADYCGVLLADSAAAGEQPRLLHTPGAPLVLEGAAWRPGEERMGTYLAARRRMGFAEGSPLAEMLAGRRTGWRADRAELKDRQALALGVGSVVAAPLRARGTVLGLLVAGRNRSRVPFDDDDRTLAAELADRAGAALDNARLYARERHDTLMLQRSLLPQTMPQLPGIEIAHRYLPAGSGAEVGGDWFDVVALAGGRAAFMVGDVMGHGLRAAATMGRVRTAVRTLAGLDLPPDELLRRVDDLSEDLALSPDEPMMATCLYAVYDTSTRICSIARAGHLPPLVVLEEPDPSGRPACRVRPVEVPPGTPLGIGAVELGAPPFHTVDMPVPSGAVLVLYTDGLVEARGHDIGEGLDRLTAVLATPHASLEDTCDHLLSTLVPASEPDDVALLLVRLGELPKDCCASWTFTAEPDAVRQARMRVRNTVAAWGLAHLADTTALLVSELVTNAMRYARAPIGVRMVRGASLLVEVSDPLPEPPRARLAANGEESGRGLQLVSRAARRWGTRPGPLGKTVWFELALPGS